MMDYEKVNLELIESVLTWIVSGYHEYPKTGSILIFLPGIAEITSLLDQLNYHHEFGKRLGKYLLLPLHSSLSSEEQSAVFEYVCPIYFVGCFCQFLFKAKQSRR